jgi:2-C-methyl-D-erythritol 4-phosphate cytidylyltransferase
MEKLIVIVAAAGQGKRMGLGMNKVFASLGALPIIIKNLQNIATVQNLLKVLIVVAGGEEEMMAGLLREYGPTCFPQLNWQIVTGGKERQDSVQNALRQITEKDCWVAVHDGARPFADAELFARVWAAARTTGAAIAAVPCKDTIKTVNDGPKR